MTRRALLGILVSLFLIGLARPAAAVDQAKRAFHEDLAQAWEDLGHEIWGLFGRWREHLTTAPVADERPLVSLMLRHRDKLGLTAEQVRSLERLRSDFQKESIRKDADLRVAEMDLKALGDAQPVDLVKMEAKVREIERLRGDLRLARIRTVEKGKEQLTAEQRKKLQELLAEPHLTRLQPRGER
jgi:Spy/CpxP family protein refolding chaperone